MGKSGGELPLFSYSWIRKRKISTMRTTRITVYEAKLKYKTIYNIIKHSPVNPLVLDHP